MYKLSPSHERRVAAARRRLASAQAKYMTWLVSWCTVTARAMADGVRSSELPDRCEPSPEHDEWYVGSLQNTETDAGVRRTGDVTYTATGLTRHKTLVNRKLMIRYLHQKRHGLLSS